jgi:DNA-binding Lrp family transcriptional regulator
MIINKLTDGNVTEVTGSEQAMDYVPYLIADSFILQRLDLTTTDKLVHTVINSFNHNNKPFFGSNQFIADSLGIRTRTVQRSLEKLEKLNILKRALKTVDKGNIRTGISTKAHNEHSPPPTSSVTYPYVISDVPPTSSVTPYIQEYKQTTILSENLNFELSEVVGFYNQIFGKSITSTKGFEKNYRYWREIHDLEVIKKAIVSASVDKFWREAMTLTVLFRKKNKNGEDVDYISDLSSREVTTAQANTYGKKTTLTIN